jgi:hypothetical protein
VGRILDGAQAVKLAAMVRPLLVYACTSFGLDLLWELLQLPLYTVWRTASVRELAFALMHCTLGDVLISTASLVLAVLMLGGGAWPARRWTRVAAMAVVLGLAYTLLSERLNVYVRRTWAYSEWMPLVPGLGIGLSPLLQWIVVPAMSFAWLRQRRTRSHAG